MSGSGKKYQIEKAKKHNNFLIAQNRKAYHDYEIIKKIEAGVELKGTEVRSLRDKSCQLTDCFVLIRNDEA